MFTGIVEDRGTVVGFDSRNGSHRLIIETDVGPPAVGDSIAVNGVCLTAVEVGEGRVGTDVVPETLSRSNLAAITPGTEVNVELAMPAQGRFDGHVVQGHVDGTGVVCAVGEGDDGVVMTISAPERLMRHIVEKGSIAVDGVSLTVSGLSDDRFEVALIPQTLRVTTLGSRSVGDVVNLETDVLAKYVERMLESRR